MRKHWILLAGLLASGCGREGVSVREMKAAAVQHARETMKLGPDSKLGATVFVGKKVDGEFTMCGFVRGTDATGRKIDPQQFVATTKPLKWVVFQSVHAASLPAEPGKFVTWSEICGRELKV